jgi:hypothetical protein
MDDLEEDRDLWRKRANIMADGIENALCDRHIPGRCRRELLQSLLDAGGQPSSALSDVQAVPYA